ncbi:MAG: hypothetical protein ACI9G1_004265, partial [Pirellulaceae bacterium]
CLSRHDGVGVQFLRATTPLKFRLVLGIAERQKVEFDW